jgi:hypothetical protein
MEISVVTLANADGTNERPLLKDPGYEYHAVFSPDSEWISFTSNSTPFFPAAAEGAGDATPIVDLL